MVTFQKLSLAQYICEYHFLIIRQLLEFFPNQYTRKVERFVGLYDHSLYLWYNTYSVLCFTCFIMIT